MRGLLFIVALVALLTELLALPGLRIVFIRAALYWLPMYLTFKSANLVGLRQVATANAQISRDAPGILTILASYFFGVITAEAVFASLVIVVGESIAAVWEQGVILGIGAVTALQVRGYFWRRLPTQFVPWNPWDQISYVLGGWLGVLLMSNSMYGHRTTWYDVMVLLAEVLIAIFAFWAENFFKWLWLIRKRINR